MEDFHSEMTRLSIELLRQPDYAMEKAIVSRMYKLLLDARDIAEDDMCFYADIVTARALRLAYAPVER